MANDSTPYTDLSTLDELDQELIIEAMREKVECSKQEKENENWKREIAAKFDRIMGMVGSDALSAPGYGKLKMVSRPGRVSVDKVKSYMVEELGLASGTVAECMEKCKGEGTSSPQFYPEKVKKPE